MALGSRADRAGACISMEEAELKAGKTQPGDWGSKCKGWRGVAEAPGLGFLRGEGKLPSAKFRHKTSLGPQKNFRIFVVAVF